MAAAVSERSHFLSAADEVVPFNHKKNSLFDLEQTTSSAPSKDASRYFPWCRIHSSSAEEESPRPAASPQSSTPHAQSNELISILCPDISGTPHERDAVALVGGRLQTGESKKRREVPQDQGRSRRSGLQQRRQEGRFKSPAQEGIFRPEILMQCPRNNWT